MKYAFGFFLFCAFAAFGVFLSLDTPNATSAATVTYAKDVAPEIPIDTTLESGPDSPMARPNASACLCR